MKDYIQQQEGINKLFKANRLQNKSIKMPKFKFGVQVPYNPSDAIRLDKVNNDNLWEGAIDKEVGSINTFKTFIILEEDKPVPEGYKQIPYHLIHLYQKHYILK